MPAAARPPGTVRDAVVDVLRHHRAHVLFGNPGTTELPFLADLPPDLRYVAGLNESSVTAIADGYAQATGRPVLVNLHTAPGLGNAMGSLVNAYAAGSPLVVLTGQQRRDLIGADAILTNRNPVLLPLGAVKHAEEPAGAQDVPAALARAFHLAGLPPTGPVAVSVPMDDWDRPLRPAPATTAITTRVTGGATAPADVLEELADRLAAARSPALVVGPGTDDRRGYWAVAELADRLAAPVWVTPWAHRLGFPTDHPGFVGQLPLDSGPAAAALEPHDLVLVLGGPVFRYMFAEQWPALAPGTELVALTDDPGQAARNLAGETVLCDVPGTVRALCRALADRGSERPPGPPPARPPAEATPGYAQAALALHQVMPPEAVLVVEPPQSYEYLLRALPRTRPGSLYFAAACGLGFALGAAVGIQLAEPERPVVALVGDGAVQYNLQALWTAVLERLPITVLVVNNGGYGILKDFADRGRLSAVPALDLPHIDLTALARGYQVPALRVPADPARIAAALRTPLPPGPRLIEVVVPAR
ncbi:MULTISPECIES: benzoylformate decarboxylase [Kitasatospora]|uniref:Putative benzoylformate decarboxylase n=1 Tax=Kitasatospora setae (strain ATCC 33774 / DSM 43861 / JCM 3304 / KCC A-0304 / NBRC 14216 / KM-6054) TaxID=452652 RepID=E4N2K7_KITSK|nr:MULTISPECIES: benzoylformate decarboxylase [Kitasatospora]BAJ32391.1 putative benzoylformate decarboxylase [Kitasatospora setae KM-6054]